MTRLIQDNTATSSARRIFLLIYDDSTACAPWAGSVTGLKAQLSTNGGSETASTSDITRVAGALHYIELTQAEANKTPGDRIHARVAGTTGRREAIGMADITADDAFVAASTLTQVGEEVALTIAGAKDLKYDDTSGTNLAVVRKSTSATVASVALRRGDRTQPVIGNG